MVTEKPKAVVLMSGGMDSCVTAAIAAQTHELAMLHAAYGQRTEKRERKAFEEIADYYGVRERLLVRMEYLAAIGGSALTDTRIAVPEVREELRRAAGVGAEGGIGGMGGVGSVEVPRLPSPGSLGMTAKGGIPVTYVPFRNAHLLSAAVSWGEVIGAKAVFIGAVEEDSSGYPDCRPEFYEAFEEVIRRGTRPETEMEIVTPVIGMRKAEIVKRGLALGAPLGKTWSCYQREDEACGLCASCVLRLRAFAGAGVEDPIPYHVRTAG